MIPNLKLNDGHSIPQLGLGTWELTGQTCVNSVKEALKIGYRHIDTADFYRNHKEIALGIKDFNREKLFITSKVWRGRLKYNLIMDDIDRFLSELNIKYLDLLLIHWPNSSIPMKDTFKALNQIKNQGKVKSIGVSNFTINLMNEAMKYCDNIVTNQVEFHPMLFQKELLTFCKENNILLTSYSPLTRGKIFDDQRLIKMSEKYNKHPAQLILRWHIQNGCVVIPKASNVKHLQSNFDIFDFTLEKEDMDEFNSFDQERLINPSFAKF